MMMQMKISVVLPAKNEHGSLNSLLPALKNELKDAEIIIVNDGSDDNTEALCREYSIKTVNHPYSKGNGAAIKSGARTASNEILVFMDADGQHRPEDIKLLLDELSKGYDMVIGARNARSQASIARRLANGFYNWFSSLITGHKIEDLTSGFRAVRANKFREFLHLLPNGFSYPTTITMSFFRAGYSVSYVPIVAQKRTGKSHINPVKDGIRFLLIIFKIGTLYSPLKLFLPISLVHFLIGASYYAYTYLSYGRFTNMSALLFITSVIIFLIGLVSEQITALQYQNTNKDRDF